MSAALRSRFLTVLDQHFAKRRKAINHRAGALYIEPLTDGDEEALVIRFVPLAPSPVIILEVTARHALSLWLRSTWNKRRGKILARLDDLRVLDNPSRIVETYEWTISRAASMDLPDGVDAEAAAEIVERWEQLVLRSVP